MPDQSPILGLPLIQPSQAQKHVTHNEALRVLDAVVQLSVADRTRTAPPAAPAVGDRHIVAAPAAGDWASRGGHVAVWSGTVWEFHLPQPGWQAWVVAEGAAVVWDGAAWRATQPMTLEAQTLGLNATANTTNRLTVAAPATLLNHDGGGHQLKINKAGPAQTASVLFQSGFSGRAEMGLAGTDSFAIKTSADGTSFATALLADAASGVVSAPQGLRFPAGSAAVPGVAVAGDPDCGLFRPAADVLALAAGGQEGARVTTQGLDAPNLTRGGSQVFSRNNILGTVSQSGGVPTGAIVQRGTTADGEFVRFADGTQICVRAGLSAANAATALGALFRSANVAWTFPAAFAAAPAVAGDVGDADCWLSTSGVSATACTLRAVAAVSKAAALPLRAVAIGRWF